MFEPGVQRYAERLAHYAKFSLVELPPKPKREDEAKALLALAGPKDVLVALDERGKPLSSVELSRWVGTQQLAAKDLLFAIGGDEGLDPAVTRAAGLTLSLSAMTLPHRLARLVLVEQLYRAFTLLKGEPYHK